jgi:hypothetical protein
VNLNIDINMERVVLRNRLHKSVFDAHGFKIAVRIHDYGGNIADAVASVTASHDNCWGDFCSRMQPLRNHITSRIRRF